jgi:hypothetical protein
VIDHEAQQMVPLRELCPAAEIWREGGQPAVFMPGVQFKVTNRRHTRDLLLWPQAREGYETRLFLSESVAASEAKNWNVFNVCGRTWYACSWRGVPSSLPWIEILANHLSAFK